MQLHKKLVYAKAQKPGFLPKYFVPNHKLNEKPGFFVGVYKSYDIHRQLFASTLDGVYLCAAT